MNEEEGAAMFELADGLYRNVLAAYRAATDRMKTPQLHEALVSVMLMYSFSNAIKTLGEEKEAAQEAGMSPLAGVSSPAFDKLMEEVTPFIAQIAQTNESTPKEVIALAFALGAKTRTVLDQELVNLPSPPEVRPQDKNDLSKF